MDDTPPVVELYPDDPRKPSTWRSQDAGWPAVSFHRQHGAWTAILERRRVLQGNSPEELAAHLYGEYGVVTVMHGAA